MLRDSIVRANILANGNYEERWLLILNLDKMDIYTFANVFIPIWKLTIILENIEAIVQFAPFEIIMILYVMIETIHYYLNYHQRPGESYTNCQWFRYILFVYVFCWEMINSSETLFNIKTVNYATSTKAKRIVKDIQVDIANDHRIMDIPFRKIPYFMTLPEEMKYDTYPITHKIKRVWQKALRIFQLKTMGSPKLRQLHMQRYHCKLLSKITSIEIN